MSQLARAGIVRRLVRLMRTAKRVDRSRATVALLACLATLAGFAFTCQTSLASPIVGQATLSVPAGTAPFSVGPAEPGLHELPQAAQYGSAALGSRRSTAWA